MIRCYTELSRFETFEERFGYLMLQGIVGAPTFGFERWMNQHFYKTREWRRVRDLVIIRDNGCDLGIEGYDIQAQLLVHHMNPVTPQDIEERRSWILDPEYLITTTLRTHNAIHYGDDRNLPEPFVERTPGDTTLW